MNPELKALDAFLIGKSRSDIGRLRAAKVAEIQELWQAIGRRQNELDLDDFASKRDRRRIGELEREVEYLSALFDPPRPDQPPEAA